MRLIARCRRDIAAIDLRMPASPHSCAADLANLCRKTNTRVMATSIWAGEATRLLARYLQAASLLSKAELVETLVPTILSQAIERRSVERRRPHIA